MDGAKLVKMRMLYGPYSRYALKCGLMYQVIAEIFVMITGRQLN